MTRDLTEAIKLAVDVLADLSNEALCAGNLELVRQVLEARSALAKRLVNDEQRRAV
jgi:hypothetical protein